MSQGWPSPKVRQPLALPASLSVRIFFYIVFIFFLHIFFTYFLHRLYIVLNVSYKAFPGEGDSKAKNVSGLCRSYSTAVLAAALSCQASSLGVGVGLVNRGRSP